MRLRFVVMAGFAGIALIFLIATVDAVRLLGAMHSENRLLQDAAMERSARLAAVRASVLRSAGAEASKDLANYPASTVEERVLVTRVGQLIERYSTQEASYEEVVEITTQLNGIDAKQKASTEMLIEDQFERAGTRLRWALGLAMAAAIVLALACLIYILRIERQNKQRYEEVVRLSAKLVDAQETERRTISRELHDQVGQTLNAVLVEAANLAPRISAEDTVSRRYLDNIRQFADTSVNSIRDIALLLRPSMLDDLGLIPALEWQAREVSRRSGIKVEIKAEDVPDTLSDDMRTCIYRVVQEALLNISRHSGAKSAQVTVKQEDRSLSLTVEDDGCGFDPTKTRGLGMLGMQERVKQLSGQFEVQSEAGKGTTLRIKLPAMREKALA